MAPSFPTGPHGEDSSSSSDDWDDGDDLLDYAKRRQRSLAIDDTKSTTTKSSDPFAPVPQTQTVALHRPVSYTERKQERDERVRKAGASGTVDRWGSILIMTIRGDWFWLGSLCLEFYYSPFLTHSTVFTP